MVRGLKRHIAYYIGVEQYKALRYEAAMRNTSMQKLLDKQTSKWLDGLVEKHKGKV